MVVPEVDVLAQRGAALGLGAVERRGAPGEVGGARRVAARGLDPVGWRCTEPKFEGRGTGGVGVGAEAGAVTITAAVGAATAAGATAVGAAAAVTVVAAVGAATTAGAGGVRSKTLHKTCKAVATVISEVGGDDEADKAA